MTEAGSEVRPLHQVQVAVDLVAAQRHAEAMGLPHIARRDEGVIIKTALTEAFGGPHVRPWRLVAVAGRIATVLGYSEAPPEDLAGARSIALPSVQAAVHEPLGGPLDVSTLPAAVGFQITVVPMMSVTGKRGERDVFLDAVDRAGSEKLDRGEVYAAWLKVRLAGLEVGGVTMTEFTLRQMSRRSRGSSVGWSQRRMPVAELRGRVRVVDRAALAGVLRSGLGRQRAFGMGLLRLTP